MTDKTGLNVSSTSTRSPEALNKASNNGVFSNRNVSVEKRPNEEGGAKAAERDKSTSPGNKITKGFWSYSIEVFQKEGQGLLRAFINTVYNRLTKGPVYAEYIEYSIDSFKLSSAWGSDKAKSDINNIMNSIKNLLPEDAKPLINKLVNKLNENFTIALAEAKNKQDNPSSNVKITVPLDVAKTAMLELMKANSKAQNFFFEHLTPENVMKLKSAADQLNIDKSNPSYQSLQTKVLKLETSVLSLVNLHRANEQTSAKISSLKQDRRQIEAKILMNDKLLKEASSGKRNLIDGKLTIVKVDVKALNAENERLKLENKEIGNQLREHEDFLSKNNKQLLEALNALKQVSGDSVYEASRCVNQMILSTAEPETKMELLKTINYILKKHINIEEYNAQRIEVNLLMAQLGTDLIKDLVLNSTSNSFNDAMKKEIKATISNMDSVKTRMKVYRTAGFYAGDSKVLVPKNSLTESEVNIIQDIDASIDEISKNAPWAYSKQ